MYPHPADLTASDLQQLTYSEEVVWRSPCHLHIEPSTLWITYHSTPEPAAYRLQTDHEVFAFAFHHCLDSPLTKGRWEHTPRALLASAQAQTAGNSFALFRPPP